MKFRMAIVLFFGGYVSALNMSTLIGNDGYPAAWWKVVVAVLISILAGVVLVLKDDKEKDE